MKKGAKQGIIIGAAAIVFCAVVGLAGYFILQPKVTITQKEVNVAGQRVVASGSGESFDKAFSKMQQDLASFYSAVQAETKSIEDLSGVKAISCSDETFDFLQDAYSCSEKTNGIFDCTAGSIYQQWGLLSGNPVLPDEGKLSQALKTVGYSQLQFDSDNKTVKLGNLGAKFYFPQLFCGKLADLGAKSILESGATSGMVSVGGTASVTGKKPDNSAYTVSLQNGETTVGTLKLESGGVAMVSSQNNTFTMNGKTYFKVLNPQTGQPADTGLSFVAVKADTAAEASAISLSLIAQGENYLKQHLNEYQAICVDSDGKLLISKQIKGIFKKG